MVWVLYCAAVEVHWRLGDLRGRQSKFLKTSIRADGETVERYYFFSNLSDVFPEGNLHWIPHCFWLLQAKGNASFSSGDFEEAIKFFTEAIDLDSSNHVLYSNRSAAKVGTISNKSKL